MLLGHIQREEVSRASRFRECRGLDRGQVEDLYQDTVLVLLERRFRDEDHLRNALRLGIRHRALHLHRDRRRRGEILSENAWAILRVAESTQRLAWPEEAALRAADGSIVSDFASELDDLERRVFALTGDGMRYRAIAARLGIPVNDARRAYRSYERKRQRFQLLYEAGRAGTESHPGLADRSRDSEQPA
jgi:RNA polymerase sigma factor (sigma-70 family)